MPEIKPAQENPEGQEPVAYAFLNRSQQQQRLAELAIVFLRLGAIAFGGPAAHIAMMNQEVVNHRQWMSREKLLDLLGITNLIPGPNSTELAIHIGYERAGWRGLLVAGSCFILPAMLIVWGLAMIYVHYQMLPGVGWLLYGIKPVMIAIVLQAVWNLGKKAVRDAPTIVAGVSAIAAYFAGLDEILALFMLGVVVMLVKQWQRRGSITGAFLLPVSGILAQAGSTTATVTSISGGSIFLFFLKVGCVLYGSGYVLLAFLQRELVDRNHWLTSQQLLDAIAIGQITPGPVFTTATFIGYLLAGNTGAIVATIGIFLPAFVLVGVVNPWVARLRQSPWASGFLDGVNAASLGLMAGVTCTLGRAALVDTLTIIMAIVSAIAVFRYNVNSVWLVLAGGAIGLARYGFVEILPYPQ
ncbi:chromate transporter [Leptolyngbya sp. 'hensonii']|uniref:chromate transporter n=1 Tax=Leptolyngbya sp. 'hensonii' TaxID=1922337 RepID=UPI00094F6A70|nr:chromate transporter [Leptolyngbya sp. 'hensonii']OLP18291.1 chromate transporter [Leptolyngbya sp. 'hensonii']